MTQSNIEKRQNKTSSKLLSFLPAIIIGALVGFGYSSLTDEPRLSNQLGSLFLFIGSTVIALFISIAIHEFSHAYAFIRNGISMKAIIIGPFILIKQHSKWKVRWKLQSLLGGIAIPDLQVIKDEADFLYHIRAYRRAIIAAPIVSICLGVIAAVVGSIHFLIMRDAAYSFILIVACSFVLVAIILTLSCFHQSQYAIGDFPAYKRLKHDRFFAAVMLYQYINFSTDYNTKRRLNTFLKPLLISELERKVQDKELDIYIASLLDTMIQEHIIGITDDLPQPVQDYVDYLFQHYQLLTTSSTPEQYRILSIHMVYLLLMQQRNDQALQLYHELKATLPDNEVYRYYSKQAEHLLGLSDNSPFLSDKRNIRLSALHAIWSHFNSYFDDELLLYQKLLANKTEATATTS